MLVYLLFELTGYLILLAQERPVTLIVKPVEIHDVLNNPGIGFTTFQRFNGDLTDSYCASLNILPV
jgi:hypothetical protein